MPIVGVVSLAGRSTDQTDGLTAAGTHRFAFVCAPLELVGAAGSSVRPVAVVEG